MSQIVYVNGAFAPHEEAMVPIEDRGFQFSDGVYEVCLVIGGAYWDREGHLARLERSLDALRIAHPAPRQDLVHLMNELIERNGLTDALVYIQVTRGVAPRNHAFPAGDVKPTLVMTAKPFDLDASDAAAARGLAAISHPDIRWGRVDIKTVSLLPNVLAKQAAVEAGANEAWLVRDGVVTEGASSNAWIVDGEGALRTHPKCERILGGITRETALACAQDLGIRVREEPFTVDEALGATEAFVSSATNLVAPIIRLDGAPIGEGVPGPVTMRLREAYKARARRGL